jgi:hypothetical protein
MQKKLFPHLLPILGVLLATVAAGTSALAEFTSEQERLTIAFRQVLNQLLLDLAHAIVLFF